MVGRRVHASILFSPAKEQFTAAQVSRFIDQSLIYQCACPAQATEKSHAVMEECLKDILAIEGWDLQTLALPESLKKKAAKSI